MTDKNNSALVTLAESIADNKFIMGDRLVEIGVSGPNLEASLASISMAQGELGHARLLYRWSYEVQGLRGGKVDVKEQTGKAFSQIVEASNWVELIAGLYVINVAIDLVLKELVKNKKDELNAQFGKMVNEQQDHLIYAKDWCNILKQEKGSIPVRFAKEIDKAVESAKEWLQRIEEDESLRENGVISVGNNLTASFIKIIDELSVERKESYVG